MKKSSVFWWGLFLTVTVANTVLADEVWVAPRRATRKKNPIAMTSASIAAGKQVYVRECLACHGPLGKGDGPKAQDLGKKPGDLSGSKLKTETDGAMFWKISTGKKPMPIGEKLLSEKDRWNVVNYMRTLSR